MLLTTRCEFFSGKGECVIDETSSDELNEPLLLKMEEEERVVVQNLIAWKPGKQEANKIESASQYTAIGRRSYDAAA